MTKKNNKQANDALQILDELIKSDPEGVRAAFADPAVQSALKNIGIDKVKILNEKRRRS